MIAAERRASASASRPQAHHGPVTSKDKEVELDHHRHQMEAVEAARPFEMPPHHSREVDVVVGKFLELEADANAAAASAIEDTPTSEQKVLPSFSTLLEGASGSRRRFRKQRGQNGRRQGGPFGGTIPGSPGTDFPVFKSIPVTSFSCVGGRNSPPMQAGFYADIETQCQVKIEAKYRHNFKLRHEAEEQKFSVLLLSQVYERTSKAIVSLDPLNAFHAQTKSFCLLARPNFEEEGKEFVKF